MKIMKYLGTLAIGGIAIFLLTASFSSCSKSTNGYEPPTPVDTTKHYDITTGLVAYYNFNGGNLNDSSGHNNNIISNNATKTTDRFGNANNAYLFDGSSSFMEVANSATLNPLDSISMFAILKINGYYTGPCSNNQILSKGDVKVNGYYGFAFYDFQAGCGTPNLDNESFGGSYGDNVPQGSSADVGSDTTLLKLNTWYYFAYTYDGNVIKMYLNGKLIDSRTKMVPFNANTANLFIGKLDDVTFPYYFNGVLDEVRIYHRALTADIINALDNQTN